MSMDIGKKMRTDWINLDKKVENKNKSKNKSKRGENGDWEQQQNQNKNEKEKKHRRHVTQKENKYNKKQCYKIRKYCYYFPMLVDHSSFFDLQIEFFFKWSCNPAKSRRQYLHLNLSIILYSLCWLLCCNS